MKTAIATAAVLLYLGVAYDRASDGWLRAADQAANSAPAQAPAGGTDKLSPEPANSAAVTKPAVSSQRALVDQYCMGCHSDRVRSGGLALSALNLDAVDQNAEVAEKVIRKLRGGLMPPAGARRPDSQSTAAFVSWLENKVDAATVAPAPGRVPLRRLNRREYAN